MRRVLLVLVVAVAGCAGYTRSKIELTAQAERGLGMVRESVERSAARDASAARLARQRLDAAFDADVAARAAADRLTPEWVLAHRKAYALARDAADGQRRAAEAAGRATLSNLDAVAAVLARLQQMHATELRLTIPEVKR